MLLISRHTGRILTLMLFAIAVITACTRDAAPPAGAAASDSGSVLLGSTRLGYVREGTGTPCLVIGSRIHHPRTFSARWKSELRCTYLDDRVFSAGSGGEPGRRYDIPMLVSDIDAARRTLGLDQFVLVGHSIIGLVALAYAQAHPEHVTHVIAIGAPPAWSQATLDAAQQYWNVHASPGRKRQDATNKARLSPDSLTKLSAGDAFVANYVASAARYWIDSTFDSSQLWSGTTLNGALLGELLDVQHAFALAASPPATVPAFVALGRFDFAVPPTLWESHSGPFRNLTVQVFDQAGHTPQLEDSEAFDAAVLTWLRR